MTEAGQGPEPSAPAGRAVFPWAAARAVAAVVLAHLAIVFALVGSRPGARQLARAGGLVAGAAVAQPWRLVTSLFVHADPAHALWNGVSMLVFAVPLLLRAGYLRTAGVYVVGGICGGLAASTAATPGTVIVGSSGAVAALFGAWLVSAVRRARHEDLPGRARIRALGIGMLVLPALLTPTTASGMPISVESHVGGFVAGAVAGAVLSRYAAPDEPQPPPDDYPG